MLTEDGILSQPRRLTIPMSGALTSLGTVGGQWRPTQHQIYLEHFTGSGPTPRRQLFHFPVNPEEIEIAHRRDIGDVSLLRLGTLARPGPATPLEVNFSAFFPSITTQWAPWLNVDPSELLDPWAARRLLRSWQVAEDEVDDEIPTPLRLSITDTEGFSIWVAISDFSTRTRPRELGDLYYSLSFREIRAVPALKRGRQSLKLRAAQAKKIRTSRVKQGSTHPARENETLAALAQRVYAESSARLVIALFAAQPEAVRKAMNGSRSGRLPRGTPVVTPPLNRLLR